MTTPVRADNHVAIDDAEIDAVISSLAGHAHVYPHWATMDRKAIAVIQHLRTLAEERRKDALYHADCRPNRQQAERAMADAKVINDRWADEVASRRAAEEREAAKDKEITRQAEVIHRLDTEVSRLTGESEMARAAQDDMDRLVGEHVAGLYAELDAERAKMVALLTEVQQHREKWQKETCPSDDYAEGHTDALGHVIATAESLGLAAPPVNSKAVRP